MTDIALSLLGIPPRTQQRHTRATTFRVNGSLRYKLLVWAFRNS